MRIKNNKLVLIALFLITFVLAVLIFKPYLSAVLTGLVFAYIFYPVYRWINSKIKMPNLSAFIVALLIILLIAIPLTYALYQLSKEVNVVYTVVRQRLSRGSIFDTFGTTGVLGEAMAELKNFINQPEPKYYIQDSMQKITGYVAETAINFIFSLPNRIVDIFVIFFVMFFGLKDGNEFMGKFEKRLPIDPKHKKAIFKQISRVTKSIVYGVFVIAIIEGILGSLTFQLAGINSVILWGCIIAITAIIPMIGASIIWVPAAIISLMQGWSESTIWIVLGGIIISSIDTFVRPKIIGDQSAVHPILIFLGFLGGIHLFGFIGFVIGPLILVLLLTFIEIIYGGSK